MNFKKLLEQYIKGQLSEEEQKQVEQEIEKFEAISDYLYESEEDEEIIVHEEEKTDIDTSAEFVKIINRSIRKAFLKLGAVVTAIVLAIVIFCIYGLSPIVASFYYNPDKKVAEFVNQMSLDWEVYSELTMPGLKRDSVSVVDKGYGKYNIVIEQTWSTNGKFTNVPGEINRGKLVLYDVNTLKLPTGNAFACTGMDGEGTLTELYEKQPDNISTWAAWKKEAAAESLEQLKDGEKYIGYVSFEQDLNFEELMKVLKEIDYEYSAWCGVRVSDEQYDPMNVGYTMELAGNMAERFDEEKYPNLVNSEKNGDVAEHVTNEEWCETHFKSMLRYMGDQEKFTKMTECWHYDFEEMENYIEKNGLNYYGIAVVAPKETLLRINEHEQVFGIYTEPLR